MGRTILFAAVKIHFYFFLMLSLIFTLPFIATAENENAGPLCRYKDLDNGNILVYRCDRFQSKGDIDSKSPQLKIVSPKQDDEIDYGTLPLSPNGKKALPITIVTSPEADYKFDFSVASNAGTEYAKLPQVDGLGHAHAYIAPEIEVTEGSGGIESVDFVEADNRSDNVGGFCVFRNADLKTADFQVFSINCELQEFVESISEDTNYRVIVDTTENSHGPRIKHHPRGVPPGDQVIITFSNVPDSE